MEDFKSILEDKLNYIIVFCTGKLKYYHYKTIKNYIFYLDKIPNKEDKEKIFEILNEYLELIKNEPNPTRDLAIEYFQNYIQPVSRFYENYFDFAPMLNLWIAIYWILIICGIEYMLHFYSLVIMITCLLIFSYFLFIHFNKLKRKVYGFMW